MASGAELKRLPTVAEASPRQLSHRERLALRELLAHPRRYRGRYLTLPWEVRGELKGLVEEAAQRHGVHRRGVVWADWIRPRDEDPPWKLHVGRSRDTCERFDEVERARRRGYPDSLVCGLCHCPYRQQLRRGVGLRAVSARILLHLPRAYRGAAVWVLAGMEFPRHPYWSLSCEELTALEREGIVDVLPPPPELGDEAQAVLRRLAAAAQALDLIEARLCRLRLWRGCSCCYRYGAPQFHWHLEEMLPPRTRCRTPRPLLDFILTNHRCPKETPEGTLSWPPRRHAAESNSAPAVRLLAGLPLPAPSRHLAPYLLPRGLPNYSALFEALRQDRQEGEGPWRVIVTPGGVQVWRHRREALVYLRRGLVLCLDPDWPPELDALGLRPLSLEEVAAPWREGKLAELADLVADFWRQSRYPRVEELAELAGVHRDTIRRWEGELARLTGGEWAGRGRGGRRLRPREKLP